MFRKKLLWIVGLTVGLLTLSAARVGAERLSCSQQDIKDAIQVVGEYSEDNVLGYGGEDAFRRYQISMSNFLMHKIDKEICLKGGNPEIEIFIIRRPVVIKVYEELKVKLTANLGKYLESPWVNIQKSNKRLRVLLIFNGRQFLYDQAKMATPNISVPDSLEPVTFNEHDILNKVYISGGDFISRSSSEIDRFWRTTRTHRRNSFAQRGDRYWDIYWFFNRVSRERPRHTIDRNGNTSARSRVFEQILDKSEFGYTLVTQHLINRFFAADNDEMIYRHILELPLDIQHKYQIR